MSIVAETRDILTKHQKTGRFLRFFPIEPRKQGSHDNAPSRSGYALSTFDMRRLGTHAAAHHRTPALVLAHTQGNHPPRAGNETGPAPEPHAGVPKPTRRNLRSLVNASDVLRLKSMGDTMQKAAPDQALDRRPLRSLVSFVENDL